ncbi:hypothetical protein PFLUV_G00041590 [Perca fluviatilis]|uniref:Uncharacterized protein n=1 Tax=Perca fluviatilis TaxID=8168 RepID=A0A6A5EPS2_PERFL|nr:hypothetical protein PFLUV_G00041590 [Perca fluviatilis]
MGPSFKVLERAKRRSNNVHRGAVDDKSFSCRADDETAGSWVERSQRNWEHVVSLPGVVKICLSTRSVSILHPSWLASSWLIARFTLYNTLRSSFTHQSAATPRYFI